MKGPLVCVFSKHLQFLDYAQLAKKCKELGLDGIDLTVREGGHVAPDKLDSDLPKAVDVIRSEGLELAMITTRLNNGADPDARPILEAAAKHRIPYVRVGGHMYKEGANPIEQLKTFTEEVRGLAKIAEECEVTLGYHNHSGYENFAGPIWDLYRMIEEVASPRFGSNFDAGHAVVEGGFGAYRTNALLMASHIKMMAVKDFVWEKKTPKWVPLGQGVVPTAEILKIAREAGFAGPISLHFEYKVASNDAMLEEVGKAAITLRAEMKRAGWV